MPTTTEHEIPLRIVMGAEENTGNPNSPTYLVLLDRLSEDRRWSVLHHGRPEMLDHAPVVAEFTDSG